MKKPTLILLSILIFNACSKKDYTLSSIYYATLSDNSKDFHSPKKTSDSITDIDDWVEVSYKSGEIVTKDKNTPYETKYDFSSNNSVTIHNPSDYDAVINLLNHENIKRRTQYSDPKNYNGFYIKSKESITIENILPGTYNFRADIGLLWKEQKNVHLITLDEDLEKSYYDNSNFVGGKFFMSKHLSEKKNITFSKNTELSLEIKIGRIIKRAFYSFYKGWRIENVEGEKISYKEYKKLVGDTLKYHEIKVFSEDDQLICLTMSKKIDL